VAKVVPGSLTEAYKRREGDFSPNLVGYQFTNSSSIFTFGNFEITTNLQAPLSTLNISTEFSEVFTLDSLGQQQTEQSFIIEQSNTLSVDLNFNRSDLSKYAYFGSLEKFVESEIQDIILKWKGSLYLDPQFTTNTNPVNTVLSYSYDQVNKTSTFLIPTSTGIVNKFGLSFEDNNNFIFEDGDISNITFFFNLYQVSNDYGDFPVVGYTGSTSSNPYITVTVEGDSWPNLSATTFGTFNYHLRPNDNVLDEFFKSLNDFQTELLNRLTVPKYTAKLEIPTITNLGTRIFRRSSFTWPVSDGFNIDIDTGDYATYLSSLFEMARDYDLDRSNIMVRRLVSNSIIEFDTEGDTTETTGRKVDKLLKIWGREYDEVKKYIDGISFANVVTYNKRDNTADELVKMLASSLGFDSIQTFSSNDLLEYVSTVNESVFSGHSRGYSIEELDTELWRRLVINAWWLFKSKGTRKVIEFFLNLFDISEDLIDLNEIVYVAEKRLNYSDVVNKLSSYFSSGEFDIDTYPIDIEGYPKTLPNTNDYYFQNDGFWYNGGNTDVRGNNPHFGPYDFGQRYFDKFRCFIDGFEAVEVTEVLNDITVNYFPDYGFGTIESGASELLLTNNGLTTDLTVSPDPPVCGNNFGSIMNNNGRITGGTIMMAGKDTNKSNSGEASFRITFNTGDPDCPTCPNDIILSTGEFFFGQVLVPCPQSGCDAAPLYDEFCCDEFGYFFEIDNNTGESLCWWCPQDLNFNLTTKEVTLPNGNVPQQSCCERRGYQFTNGKCLIPEAEINVNDGINS